MHKLLFITLCCGLAYSSANAQLKNGFYRETIRGYKVKSISDTVIFREIDTVLVAHIENIDSIVRIDSSDYMPHIRLYFNKAGTQEIHKATQKPDDIALVYNGYWINSFGSYRPITNGCARIVGSSEEMDKMRMALAPKNCGVLPFADNVKLDLIDTTMFNRLDCPEVGLSIHYPKEWNFRQGNGMALCCEDASVEKYSFTIEAIIGSNFNEMVQDNLQFRQPVEKILFNVLVDGIPSKMFFVDRDSAIEPKSWRIFHYFVDNGNVIYKIKFFIAKDDAFERNLQLFKHSLESIHISKTNLK